MKQLGELYVREIERRVQLWDVADWRALKVAFSKDGQDEEHVDHDRTRRQRIQVDHMYWKEESEG